MTFLPNDPDRHDPTRKCTCGFRRFRTKPIRTEEAVDRWVLFDDGAFAGMGSIPFGLPFGSGSAGEWGLFPGTRRSFSEQVVCENCTRIRSTKLKSAFAIFGSFVLGDTVCIIVSDVAEGVGAGCLELRFDGPGPVPNVSPSLSYPIIPLAAPAPGGATFPSPPGPFASMLCATLPPAVVEGVYTIVFVDRCSGYEESLGTVTLESDVITLNPKDADLNGAPAAWVDRNLRAKQEVVQIGSGSIQGIPFDKCDEVVEYDARFGTLPDAQGFTLLGTLPSGLLPGGVLQMTSAGGAVTGSWRKDITTSALLPGMSMYSRFQHRANIDPDAFGAGMNFLGGYAAGSAGPLSGGRMSYYEAAIATMLDASAETTLAGPFGKELEGWREIALQGHDGDDVSLVHGEHSLWETHPMFATFGTIVGPAPAVPMIRGEFGDMTGTGVDTLLRNFVVSGPGRFVRAWFNAFATVDDPIVRLNLVSDQKVGSFTTARFLVRYGSQAQGDDPYMIPASTAAVTVDFIVQNQIFVASFTMTGVTAGQPFWFTVERDHTHPDDQGEATAFLTSATVRAV